MSCLKYHYLSPFLLTREQRVYRKTHCGKNITAAAISLWTAFQLPTEIFNFNAFEHIRNE